MLDFVTVGFVLSAPCLFRRTLLATLLVGCGGSSDGPPAPRGDPTTHCAAICERWATVECGEPPLADCEDKCRQAWSGGSASACASQINAVYSCELEQPVDAYSCVAGFPSYDGQACSAEEAAAQACLVRHGGRHPGCERVCELDAAYCPTVGTVDSCKRSCVNVDRLGSCSVVADAWYDCISQTPLNELTCDGGVVGPVDGSCGDELAALTTCVT